MYKSFTPILSTKFFCLEKADPKDTNSEDPYYRITGADSVISCILDQSDNFILVRQYRPNLEMYTLEPPAGAVEIFETPIEAMQREISEETGMRCALMPLGRNFGLMMNRTNIRDYLFFGMYPEQVTNNAPEAGIELIRIPRHKLYDMTLHGDFLHLAMLGIMQITGGLLKVDMWQSSYTQIEASFRSQTKIFINDKE